MNVFIHYPQDNRSIREQHNIHPIPPLSYNPYPEPFFAKVLIPTPHQTHWTQEEEVLQYLLVQHELQHDLQEIAKACSPHNRRPANFHHPLLKTPIFHNPYNSDSEF